MKIVGLLALVLLAVCAEAVSNANSVPYELIKRKYDVISKSHEGFVEANATRRQSAQDLCTNAPTIDIGFQYMLDCDSDFTLSDAPLCYGDQASSTSSHEDEFFYTLNIPKGPQWSGIYQITTCTHAEGTDPGDELDTLITVYCGECDNLQCFGYNDDLCLGDRPEVGELDTNNENEFVDVRSTATFHACAGETYHIRISLFSPDDNCNAEVPLTVHFVKSESCTDAQTCADQLGSCCFSIPGYPLTSLESNARCTPYTSRFSCDGVAGSHSLSQKSCAQNTLFATDWFYNDTVSRFYGGFGQNDFGSTTVYVDEADLAMYYDSCEAHRRIGAEVRVDIGPMAELYSSVTSLFVPGNNADYTIFAGQFCSGFNVDGCNNIRSTFTSAQRGGQSIDCNAISNGPADAVYTDVTDSVFRYSSGRPNLLEDMPWDSGTYTFSTVDDFMGGIIQFGCEPSYNYAGIRFLCSDDTVCAPNCPITSQGKVSICHTGFGRKFQSSHDYDWPIDGGVLVEHPARNAVNFINRFYDWCCDSISCCPKPDNDRDTRTLLDEAIRAGATRHSEYSYSVDVDVSVEEDTLQFQFE